MKVAWDPLALVTAESCSKLFLDLNRWQWGRPENDECGYIWWRQDYIFWGVWLYLMETRLYVWWSKYHNEDQDHMMTDITTRTNMEIQEIPGNSLLNTFTWGIESTWPRFLSRWFQHTHVNEVHRKGSKCFQYFQTQ